MEQPHKTHINRVSKGQGSCKDFWVSTCVTATCAIGGTSGWS